MARVLTIDDYPLYAEMVSLLLAKHGGHETKSITVPFDASVIDAFDPDVIVVSLVRKTETLASGKIQRFDTDIEGAKALRALDEGLVGRRPLVICALAVRESELPPGLRYAAFLEFPQKLDALLDTVERLSELRKDAARIVPDQSADQPG